MCAVLDQKSQNSLFHMNLKETKIICPFIPIPVGGRKNYGLGGHPVAEQTRRPQQYSPLSTLGQSPV